MRPSFFIPLLAATYASAHGFVSVLTVDGKPYQGNVPNGAKNPTVIRQISTTSPTKGATNPDVNCGPGAIAGSQVASANPGSTLTFKWLAGDDGSNWPHNIGPMFTYLASCGSQTCDKFDSTQAKWFKIQQEGRKANGDWVQQDLMNGEVATVQLPSTLAPGNYMVRHEIIALHLATSLGGAEFYPSCSQLSVGGSQTGAPKDSELVSLPGAYSDNDPGIFDPNVFDKSAPYTFPGPAIASFVSGTASGNSAATGSNASPSSSSSSGSSGSKSSSSNAANPTSSSSTTSSSNSNSGKTKGTCSLKKKKTSSAALASSTAASSYKPRHMSRVMRDLVFGRSH